MNAVACQDPRLPVDLAARLALSREAAYEVDALAQMLVREAEADKEDFHFVVRAVAARLTQLFMPLMLHDSTDTLEEGHRVIYGVAVPFAKGGEA